MFWTKKKKESKVETNSKYKLNDYVDFYYNDDVYFGHISNIYLVANKEVIYDIDIAGQCPATLKEIKEEKIFRLHK